MKQPEFVDPVNFFDSFPWLMIAAYLALDYGVAVDCIQQKCIRYIILLVGYQLLSSSFMIFDAILWDYSDHNRRKELVKFKIIILVLQLSC